MNVTAKDLDEIGKKTAKWEAVFRAAIPVLRPLFWLVYKIGFIRRAAARSVGGRTGAIYRCEKRGEYDKAAELAIDALKAYRHEPERRFRVGGREMWWFFMDLAAENLDRCVEREKRDVLIEMAKDGIEPFEDHYAARSYMIFARWKYQEKGFDAAIAFAEAAVQADDTWAEAEYALGWYCLARGRDDAMHHLSQAVAKDPQIVSRIADDPIWEHRPDVLEKLKELSAEELVTAGDRPAAEDRDGSVG